MSERDNELGHMAFFARYRISAVDDIGEVFSTGIMQQVSIAEYMANGDLILVVEENILQPNHYVRLSTGTIHEKEDSTAVITGKILSGLPEGAVLRIDGETYAPDDDMVELDFTMPGVYNITITSPTQKTKVISYEKA